MSREIWHSNSDFDMIYDDWMIITKEEIKPNIIVAELVKAIDKKYPENKNDETDEAYNHLYSKALVMQQKMAMLQYAVFHYQEAKKDFESTQCMNIPALYGMGKTKILFYVEAAIVFARNLLDVGAHIYSDILLDCREDSFNKLCKKIAKQTDPVFTEFKNKLAYWGETDISTYRLLCGVEKGRALRDIIIHQTNVKLSYYEYKEGSEKERLFIELAGYAPIDLDIFVEEFVQGLKEIIDECDNLCRRLMK